MKKTIIFESLLLAVLALFLVFYLISNNIFNFYSEHYAVESFSLMHGHFDLLTDRREKFLDTVIVNNKIYFAADPGTAILLLPFSLAAYLLYGGLARQWPLNLLSLVVSAFTLFKILEASHLKRLHDKLWLVIAFFFATSMVSIIYVPNTWNLAQTVGISLTLLYIYFWIASKGKRKWLCLILIPLIAFTRKQLLVPLVIVSVCETVITIITVRGTRVRDLALFILAIVLTSFASYRLYERWYYKYFAIPIGMGASTGSYNLPIHKELLRRYGQFNSFYLAKNLYYYFLKTPEPIFQSDVFGSNLKPPYISPSTEGTSFFLLSPILLSLFFIRPPNLKSVIPWYLAVLSLGYLYLTFFTTGSDQFGLRYSADLVPFLFVPLALSLKDSLSAASKILILASSLFNAFLLFSYFASGKTL